MNIVDMPWNFDHERFYKNLKSWCEDNDTTHTELSESIGLNASYVSHMKKANAYPTMRNFLSLCYLCDLDPRDYFYIMPPPETPAYLK